MNDRTRRDRVRAEYAATVACYHTPASRRTKDYYANGKHGTCDGVPIWRPKWYGELGNDAEFREATKPRTTFKSAYYLGGHRMTVDGIPVRVAAYVKDWSAWMKRAIGAGQLNAKETAQLETQMEILWPLYGREQELKRNAGQACCVACHGEFHVWNDRQGNHVECWHCKKAGREGDYTQAQYDQAKAA